MSGSDLEDEHENGRDRKEPFRAGDSLSDARGFEAGSGDRLRAGHAADEPFDDVGETPEPWGVTEWVLAALKWLSVPVALLGGLVLFAGFYLVLFAPFGEVFGYVIMWLGAVLILPACYFWWKWVDRVIQFFRR